MQLTPEQIATLQQVTPQGSGLVVVASATQTGANAVARAWAKTFEPADTVVFAPAADRYRTDEVSAALKFAGLVPTQRNTLVFTSAETLDASLFSRLLRTLEEPPAPTLFVLAVPSDLHLPAPVQGRVTGTITLQPDTNAFDLDTEVHAALFPRVELASAVRLEHLHLLDLVLYCDTAADIPAAVKALGQIAPTSPVARDVLRLVAFRRSEAVDPLATSAPQQLAGIDKAVSLISRFASPASVLAALMQRFTPRTIHAPHPLTH